MVEPAGTTTGTQMVTDCPGYKVVFNVFPAAFMAVEIELCPKAAVVAVTEDTGHPGLVQVVHVVAGE